MACASCGAGCPGRGTGPTAGTVGLRLTCFVCTSQRGSVLRGGGLRARSQSRSVRPPKHAGRAGTAPYRSRPGAVLTLFQGPAGVAVRRLCRFGERLLGVPPARRGAPGSARCGSAVRPRPVAVRVSARPQQAPGARSALAYGETGVRCQKQLTSGQIQGS